MKFSSILAAVFSTIVFATVPEKDYSVVSVNIGIIRSRINTMYVKGKPHQLGITEPMCPSLTDCAGGGGITRLCLLPEAKDCTALVASRKKGAELALMGLEEYVKIKGPKALVWIPDDIRKKYGGR